MIQICLFCLVSDVSLHCCLLLLYIFMIWGDHKLFSRVAYLRGWHSRVWPFKWKLFPMLKEVLHYGWTPNVWPFIMKAIGQYLLFILYCIFNVAQGGFTFLSFWMKHQCVTIQNETGAFEPLSDVVQPAWSYIVLCQMLLNLRSGLKTMETYHHWNVE